MLRGRSRSNSPVAHGCDGAHGKAKWDLEPLYLGQRTRGEVKALLYGGRHEGVRRDRADDRLGVVKGEGVVPQRVEVDTEEIGLRKRGVYA